VTVVVNITTSRIVYQTPATAYVNMNTFSDKELVLAMASYSASAPIQIGLVDIHSGSTRVVRGLLMSVGVVVNLH